MADWPVRLWDNWIFSLSTTVQPIVNQSESSDIITYAFCTQFLPPLPSLESWAGKWTDLKIRTRPLSFSGVVGESTLLISATSQHGDL